jgi:nucleoid-associated protein YgaU
MKKLLILLAALSLVACGDKELKEETTTETAPVVLEQVVEEEASDMGMEEAAEATVMEETSDMDMKEAVEATTMGETSDMDMKEVVEATAMEEAPSTYIVKEGDNLFRIGLKYNMLWTKIVEENNIENPDDIYVGQEIKIPQN